MCSSDLRFSTNAPHNMAEIVENLRRSPYYHQYNLFPNGLRCLHLVGTRALSISADSLLVIQLSEPAAPRILRECKLGFTAWDVRGAGRYAYVMDWGAKIHVVDLGDAASPGPIARFDSRGYASAALAVRDAGRAVAPAPEFAGIPPATNAPVLVDPERLPNGAFAFTLRAQAGADYVLQISSDLATWTHVVVRQQLADVRRASRVLEIPSPPAEQTGIVDIATETDLALGLNKVKGIDIATEANSALGLNKVKGIGIATETDLALGLNKVKGIGITTETDLALGLNKSKEVGIATEANLALALAATRVVLVLLATEEIGRAHV